MRSNRLIFLGHIITAALLAASGAVCAQGYPIKPIRVIVPFPPGGANDIAIRTLNTRLPSLLGENLIIDSRPGAGGNIVDVKDRKPSTLPVDALKTFAGCIQPLGWHMEFLMHADEFPDLADRLADWFPDARLRNQVLVTNPAGPYGF